MVPFQVCLILIITSFCRVVNKTLDLHLLELYKI